MKTGKFLTTVLAATLMALQPTSCNPKLNIEPVKPVTPTTDPNGDEGDETIDLPTEPASCTNKIVAHRGGSSECGAPDNSRTSLKYAMGLKCYAMECDIYWTKDNDIVVAHATDTYFINNLKPWEHTLEELRKAGKLSNGEELPSLTEFLDIVQVEGNCTKLCLDIKNLDGTLTDYPIKAVQRACEIIAARKAEKFCEFICTSNTAVAAAAAVCQTKYGIPVGWMSNSEPHVHLSKGFTWANLSTVYIEPYGTHATQRTIDQYLNAGMEFSVYNVDKQKGDGNAAYSDEAVAYFVSRYKDLRCICTNYPKWLLSKVQ
ncbi:MAG: glycerophosphodiester phosphodiesterase [Bacteroidales bacterium]|jgi:glycerophosphoryl diester phosphodiesterase|nr:glycerophosphodiester phosphodiesterase [Bacteroidales bacterium]